ncbi:MAG TPA: hypothetical protein VGP46_06135 [Acidimicrobiales bacterium]|nr:hypothetical protein [Acidimicrobiales bacterium]
MNGPPVPGPPPRIALVGDRSTSVQAHAKIPGLVETLNIGRADAFEIYWMHSTAVESSADVAGFDGVWVIPGSPYANSTGVLEAIKGARTSGIPLLGTCGGFQHLVIEFARNVCGLAGVQNAEEHPDAAELIIRPLECSLLGEDSSVVVEPGTLAAAAIGQGLVTERFFCRYGLDPAYLETLVAHGLVVSGRDPLGDVRIVELPGHPFFVGSLFQPELSSDASWVHPLIAAFTAAVAAQAAGRSVLAPAL